MIKIKRLNHGPLSNTSIEAIYREIMSASISLQVSCVYVDVKRMKEGKTKKRTKTDVTKTERCCYCISRSKGKSHANSRFQKIW